jgi:hypothetical protein
MFFDVLKSIKVKSKDTIFIYITILLKENKEERMVDALALRGDEGRDKLR